MRQLAPSCLTTVCPGVDGDIEYLVRWKGSKDEKYEPTWEPEVPSSAHASNQHTMARLYLATTTSLHGSTTPVASP